MGGSFISLLASKWIAKKSTGAQVIEQPRNATEHWLVETVGRQAREADIGVPEIAVYQSPDINAFATGADKNNALVAVSTGLLQSMTKAEAEAVLAHEVSHVANGDMVTLSLIQGVVNTFVMFFARVIGLAIDSFLRGQREGHHGPGIGFWVGTIFAEIILGFLATMIVMWFSRWREFRADAGGASLAGREKMIAALERLRAQHQPSHLPTELAAFGINGGLGAGLKKLFLSHPPLEQRIAALRAAG
jgi:heat shock protein HtpX